MLITSSQAGYLCDVSSSYFQRFAKDVLEVKPAAVRGPGGRSSRWGVRHVLAAMMVPTLEGLGVSSGWALLVAQSLATEFHSDEQCEAHIEGGRCFIVIAGANAVPTLQTAADVEALDKELGAGLKSLGIGMRAIDLRELLQDIRRAAGAEVEDGALTGEGRI